MYFLLYISESNQLHCKIILKHGKCFKKPSAQQKNKLNEIFEALLTKASIDYSNQEIQDIQAAVNTMLKRVVAKVNERGIFNVSRFDQCGSMAEKNITLEAR